MIDSFGMDKTLHIRVVFRYQVARLIWMHFLLDIPWCSISRIVWSLKWKNSQLCQRTLLKTLLRLSVLLAFQEVSIFPHIHSSLTPPKNRWLLVIRMIVFIWDGTFAFLLFNSQFSYVLIAPFLYNISYQVIPIDEDLDSALMLNFNINSIVLGPFVFLENALYCNELSLEQNYYFFNDDTISIRVSLFMSFEFNNNAYHLECRENHLSYLQNRTSLLVPVCFLCHVDNWSKSS